jgi:hypothetical protein
VKIRFLVYASVMAAGLAAPVPAADKPEDLAQRATEAWLKLSDAADGTASWEQAAKPFKAIVRKEQWTQTLASSRSRLGAVVSRKLTSRQFTEKLPGSPDGKYVVIQYEAAYEKKGSAVETITSTLEPDGVWRVSWYVIR